jgi:DNA-binding transcriptional MerR regulator
MSNPVFVSEAARELGVAPETVRVWERRGLLRATRTPSGTRVFERADVLELARKREAARHQTAHGGEMVAGVA